MMSCIGCFQPGPPDGKDKVKKGGSFMCHEVGGIRVISIDFVFMHIALSLKKTIVMHQKHPKGVANSARPV